MKNSHIVQISNGKEDFWIEENKQKAIRKLSIENPIELL